MSELNSLVLREDQGSVATLTLNNPRKLNALSADMIAALAQHLDALHLDVNIRVVIIAANGKAFSAGHDLKEIQANPDVNSCQTLFSACSNMMLKISALPQPVIAKVHGIAAAAGCQLVAQCDLAIASTTAKFATPGINLGLFCATPSVPLSRNIGKKAAAEMLYTGRFIKAEEAAQNGLINRAVGPEILDVEVENLSLEIASKSPTSIARGKALFLHQLHLPIEDAYDLAGRAMADNVQDSDTREGITSFVEKRPQPIWKNRT